ncbi:pseudouridine synthase [Desulfoluna butyratoxydans]|uniref:Pseudouridine synthase rsua/rlub/c/d/e/f n=1 Tax=Desulfoluna butyratoxydans TaxID=231438 RepID=A0A4U8YNV1_9BACT|nr:pseudouridine synthase [Desulfoluna butyratoxydans]VFQ42893.1 pseudouridine synthase rsua/rlub/c/d/e/f [Desulfoluna butyratoxydans]
MSRSPYASTVTVGEAVPSGTPILAFLEARFPAVPSGTWEARLDSGLVTDEKGAALTRDAVVVPMMVLRYYREVAHEDPIPFAEEVVHVDDHLIVACKPHFLPVIPAGKFVNETLLTRLRNRFENPELIPVNRIDRETAGLVLFSRRKETRGLYQGLFMEKKVSKVYEALSLSRPDGVGPFHVTNRLVKGDPWFRMAVGEGPSNAESTIELVAPKGAGGLFRISPVTGKKHQVRLHMCAIGAPIENDHLYPDLLDEAPPDFERPLKLLAKEVRFIDPVTQTSRCFISPRSLD